MRRGVVDQVMDDLLAEGSFEADERYYYWDVFHRPAYQWQAKQQTSPASLTNAAASNRHVQIWNDWSRTLGLSGGWLYIARYYWNGQNWVRDRCDMRNLQTMAFSACA
jgi:hypothetical protein